LIRRNHFIRNILMMSLSTKWEPSALRELISGTVIWARGQAAWERPALSSPL
jgi:hypothetical protein